MQAINVKKTDAQQQGKSLGEKQTCFVSRRHTGSVVAKESLPQDFPDTPAWKKWRMFTDAALESQNWHDWSAMLGPSDARPRRHQCKTSTS